MNIVGRNCAEGGNSNIMNTIRVALVDDHPVVRRGLMAMLSTYSHITVVGEACDSHSAVNMLNHTIPEILLLDLKMPGSGGLCLIRHIKSNYPEIKIIILTVYDDDEYVCESIAAGADAYVLKSIAHEELINIINVVHKGGKFIDQPLVGKIVEEYSNIVNKNNEYRLTNEEIDILRLVASGMKNRDIAEQCHWSEVSVKRKLQIIYQKLDVRDRAQAVATAIWKGLL